MTINDNQSPSVIVNTEEKEESDETTGKRTRKRGWPPGGEDSRGANAKEKSTEKQGARSKEERSCSSPFVSHRVWPLGSGWPRPIVIVVPNKARPQKAGGSTSMPKESNWKRRKLYSRHLRQGKRTHSVSFAPSFLASSVSFFLPSQAALPLLLTHSMHQPRTAACLWSSLVKASPLIDWRLQKQSGKKRGRGRQQR